jgi:hypothetical protein
MCEENALVLLVLHWFVDGSETLDLQLNLFSGPAYQIFEDILNDTTYIAQFQYSDI